MCYISPWTDQWFVFPFKECVGHLVRFLQAEIQRLQFGIHLSQQEAAAITVPWFVLVISLVFILLHIFTKVPSAATIDHLKQSTSTNTVHSRTVYINTNDQNPHDQSGFLSTHPHKPSLYPPPFPELTRVVPPPSFPTLSWPWWPSLARPGACSLTASAVHHRTPWSRPGSAHHSD